ncbi:uncharacterized protein LOC141909537 [Tubulanus polymorphus]|uniref:uncharacterized protein LOC141909537 n=1 Tax=Tubulanus polymorphus TaxID=672921 RepID=UPI003DA43118
MEPAKQTDAELKTDLNKMLDFWIGKLECNGDAVKQHEFKRKFIRKLRNADIAIETDTANDQHYQVPTKYFKEILGKRMKYSSCVWPDNSNSLEEAEDYSLSIICKRAQVEDGQTIMDLGCGWGATGLYICEKYPNCKVVFVSNSETQHDYIIDEAKRLGFDDRIEHIKANANTFDTEKKFDRVISIEMFEHMKNYDRLLAKISSWLKPDGLLLTQILCHLRFPYNFDASKDKDTEWMARNFFAGGTMPSADLFLYFQDDMIVTDQWLVNGKDYSKTLYTWLERLDAKREKVHEIFIEFYGADKADEMLANWRMFFIYCGEVFRYRDGNDWLTAFHLFKKRNC